jgi:hypothetical protein
MEMVYVDVLPNALRLCGMWPEEEERQVSEQTMRRMVRQELGKLSGVYLWALVRVCSALAILQDRGRKG